MGPGFESLEVHQQKDARSKDFAPFLFASMDRMRAYQEQETKEMLAPAGKFVFAVDTIADRCENDSDYKTTISVKTEQGFDLLLRSKNYYDEETQTQFSPAIYELYNGTKLLQSEPMDFQTHLYKFGEMEHYLKEIGFTIVKTYSVFGKIEIEQKGAKM